MLIADKLSIQVNNHFILYILSHILSAVVGALYMLR